jgi:hypothetical protein
MKTKRWTPGGLTVNKDAVIKWLKTAVIAALGGGIAAIVATAADPAKYHFPRDLGSGKMWPYFLQGIALTFGAMLLKSPLGQKVVEAMKDSQAQLKQSQADLAQAKDDLKTGTTPPSSGSPPKKN